MMTIRDFKCCYVIPFGILMIGIFLRLFFYFQNCSLWLDEAYGAINIVHSSLSDLLQFNTTFPNQPQYPLLFSILIKILVQIFGNAEWVLRLLPASSSAGSLFLFYALSRRILPGKFNWIALGVFSLSDPLISYSALVKPYASDLLLALAVYHFCLTHLLKSLNIKNLTMFSLGGVLLIWASHPSLFILAGMWTALILIQWRKGNWKGMFHLLIAIIPWIISFFVLYLSVLHQMISNVYILGTWRGSLAPLSEGGGAVLMWTKNVWIRLFTDPVGLAFPAAQLLIFLYGGMRMTKRNSHIVLLLVMPLLLAFLASLLRLYPFQGRMLAFAVPAIVIILTQGVISLWEQKSIVIRSGAAAILLLWLASLITGLDHRPGKILCQEDNREVLKYYHDRVQPGDYLLLNVSGQFAYWYYFHQMNFNVALKPGLDDGSEWKQRVIRIYDHLTGPADNRLIWYRPVYYQYAPRGVLRTVLLVQDPVSALTNSQHAMVEHPRVWVFLSHIPPQTQEILLNMLNRTGRLIQKIEKRGAAIYLFNFEGIKN